MADEQVVVAYEALAYREDGRDAVGRQTEVRHHESIGGVVCNADHQRLSTDRLRFQKSVRSDPVPRPRLFEVDASKERDKRLPCSDTHIEHDARHDFIDESEFRVLRSRDGIIHVGTEGKELASQTWTVDERPITSCVERRQKIDDIGGRRYRRERGAAIGCIGFHESQVVSAGGQSDIGANLWIIETVGEALLFEQWSYVKR